MFSRGTSSQFRCDNSEGMKPNNGHFGLLLGGPQWGCFWLRRSGWICATVMRHATSLAYFVDFFEILHVRIGRDGEFL